MLVKGVPDCIISAFTNSTNVKLSKNVWYNHAALTNLFQNAARYNMAQYYMIMNIARYRQIQEYKWLPRHLNYTASQVFVQQSAQADIKAPHHWCFVKGIHRWLVDTPHKGPVMRKRFKCHDVFIFEPTIYNTYLTLTGEIRDVYFRHSVENWQCYKGTALYWHRAGILTIFDLIMLHISVPKYNYFHYVKVM